MAGPNEDSCPREKGENGARPGEGVRPPHEGKPHREHNNGDRGTQPEWDDQHGPLSVGASVDVGDTVGVAPGEIGVLLHRPHRSPEPRPGETLTGGQRSFRMVETLIDRRGRHPPKDRYGACGATDRQCLGFPLLMDDLTTALAADLDGTFPTVVEAMGSQLFWGLRRICGNHQEAEDLTQETFIRAYRALEGYGSTRIREMKLQSWLWTIALNLGRNHVRDRSRRPTYVELSEAGVDDPEPIDDLAWDRRLSTLSAPQRAAVVLRHVAGLNIAEISEITGRPEGTVKADVHRGLARLRETIEGET